MKNSSSIQLNGVDIEWDIERGNVSFFGLDSVLFWTNPSLYRLLAPLVVELGPDLFRVLVAHSSSLGTEEDYELMVTKLGHDFVSGFLAWGEAVATAGWGRFEVLAFDPVTCTAHVRVNHPWELQMQSGRPELWGCPFLQGKIIGLFTHAFKRPCWADETTVQDDPARPYLDLHVYPSNRELGSELAVLRQAQFVDRERLLMQRVDAATADLVHKIEVIDEQRALIARLTYPILQVWDGVLAAVLVGELTEAGMTDLTFALLTRVQTARAQYVILDCTGVLNLSVSQAAALARLVAALRLLGSQAILVGLSPAVARQLASESVALAGARVLQTLADALERIVGLRRI